MMHTAHPTGNEVEVGKIVEVHGPVVTIYCPKLPPLRQALRAHIDHEDYLFEVHQHIDEHHLRAITLHDSSGLWRGMPVFDSGAPLHVPVTQHCLGRMLDVFGQPLDGGEKLHTREYRNICGQPLALYEAKETTGILETGIKVIDLLCPFIKGGKPVYLAARA